MIAVHNPHGEECWWVASWLIAIVTAGYVVDARPNDDATLGQIGPMDTKLRTCGDACWVALYVPGVLRFFWEAFWEALWLHTFVLAFFPTR